MIHAGVGAHIHPCVWVCLNEMAQDTIEMCVCMHAFVRARQVRWAAKHRHSKNLFLLFWSEFKCSSKTVCLYDGAGGWAWRKTGWPCALNAASFRAHGKLFYFQPCVSALCTLVASETWEGKSNDPHFKCVGGKDGNISIISRKKKTFWILI